jgi:hypothetical protein
MTQTNILDNEQRFVQTTSRRLKSQVRCLIAAGGGLFRSVKALKANYAIMQSLAPDRFPLNWNALFFSIYSRHLHDAVECMVLDTGELGEILWGRGVEPYHHIYFLTERRSRSLEEMLGEFREQPYFEDFLLWSVLPPAFSLYWSYFLEMISYEMLDPKIREAIPYLPLIRTAKDERLRERLLKAVDKLQHEFANSRIGSLSIGDLSVREDNNLYIFLPFKFAPDHERRFLDFYRSPMHNQFVKVHSASEPGTFSVQIDPSGITSIYRYIRLELEDVRIATERFHSLPDFDRLVYYFETQVRGKIPMNRGFRDYLLLNESMEARVRYLRGVSDKVKKRVVDKGKYFLSLLLEHYELADWRFKHIIRTLETVATISESFPINLLCKPAKLEPYVPGFTSEHQTMIAFEFSEDFRNRYREEFEHGLPSGNLHHIYHFVQPEEVLKAIHHDREKALLHGGPVWISAQT